jgi:predicted transcriptional regulator of viral defense system
VVFKVQNIKILQKTLERITPSGHDLFTISDLSQIFPNLSYSALKALVNRAEKSEILKRICRGIYLYEKSPSSRGMILYKTASKLRSNCFNYLSLESVLSEVGIISQVPMSWLSFMSTGRSSIIKCENYGTIEFVHTKKKIESFIEDIYYDTNYNIWKANVKLALKDMKYTGRSDDLIDWSAASEFI